MSMPETIKPRRSRLNMRIPVELLSWARGYVKSRHTNITQLFVDHLTKLKEKSGAVNGKAAEHR